MNHSDIRLLLTHLGFKATDGAKARWQKTYGVLVYALRVDFANESIDYGASIELGDKTTSNFQADENFVVLS